METNIPQNTPITPLVAPPTVPLLPEPSFGEKLYKQLIVIGVAILLIIVGAVLIYFVNKIIQEPPRAPAIITQITTSTMIIASDAFKNNEYIPGKYTCDGTDVNPPLRFADIPEGTLTLALIVDDPDAPSGDWVHWLVWNMPADTKIIAEDSVPTGADQGVTDFDASIYGGPCPHSGTHHYQFKLYALNAKLNLPANAKKSDLLAVMQGHIIAEAQLTGMYSRSN